MTRQSSILTGISILLLAAFLLSSCSQVPALPADNVDNNEQTTFNHEQELLDEPESPSDSGGTVDSDPALENLRMAIYGGIGAWDLNVTALQNFFSAHELSYELIDENDVTSLKLSDHYDLIWFPGGFAGEYRYLITNLDPLIDFVDQGGYYVGSCAGAYFAADILSWLGEDGKDSDYPLNFFPGRAAGPLINELNWGDEAVLILNKDIAANSAFEPSLPVYYFDGPYFDAFPEADYFILARYETNNQPAVVAGYHGAGKYLLFGPHPEMGGISVQSGDYNLEGGNNAQWDWLLAVLYWFGDW